MRKLLKTITMAVCLCACAGSFALGATTKASAELYYETMDPLIGRTPECALVLEEAKIKNMTDWGYYNVDGEDDVWYFMGNGTATANPEIRFITDGTQTVTKPYTLEPIYVESFSFMYRIENSASGNVEDTNTKYIVQILASDGSYPIIRPTITENGDWNTVEVNQFTPVSNSLNGATTYAGVADMFCGFLFKMGNLNGELMISNIEIVTRGGAILPPLNPYEEPELPETSEEPEAPEVSEEPELPETSQEPEVPATSEEPTTSEPSTNEPTTSEKEGVLAMLGCNATASGASVLLGLAGAGFVMAIRKRKE